MDDRVSCSQYCMLGVILSSKESDYKIIHIAVHLLVAVLNDDCRLLYVYAHVSIIRRYYSCYLFVVYVHNNDVNLLVEFVVMSVSIRSHKDNYYTNVPNIYIQLGDSVDCSI